MLRPAYHITIGKLTFTYVHEGETDESWESGTDTVSFTLPRRLVYRAGTIVKEDLDETIAPLFKRGDAVEISMGYEKPVLIFKGYLVRIGTHAPITLHCEDQMWKLKQKFITHEWVNFKIGEIVKDLMDGTSIPYQVTIGTPYGLGSLRVTNYNVAQVLEELRDRFGIQSFFRNGTLYVGDAYPPILRRNVEIRMDRHVSENSLEYRNKDDHRVKVVVKTKRKNKVYEATAKGSDSDGDLVTITRLDMDPANLQAEADRLLPQYKYEGFEGSLTIFGTPLVFHGDEVTLIDLEVKDNRGQYLVKSVKRSFGIGGIRQTLEIDQRV